MKRQLLTSVIFSGVMALAPLQMTSATPSQAASRPQRTIRIEFREGSAKTVRLSGVGCEASMCSTVAVASRAAGRATIDRSRFDDLVSIQELCDDAVLLVFNDGTTRRVSVVADNRVLYVVSAEGSPVKIPLSHVRSITFSASAAR